MNQFRSLIRVVISKFKGEIKLVFLILLSIFSINCTRYATKEQLNFIKNFEQEVYQFEIQTKTLKEKTLELEREKYDLMKKIKECRKKLDEIQTILTDTSKNDN